MPESDFLARLEKINVPFIIAVGGDSGSGKTTFVKGIRSIMGKDWVSSFSLDDYHTEDRAQRKVSGRLPLDPGMNDLALLADHLRELKKGNAIVKPVYDHGTGAFAPEEVFEPKRIVIIEGLHPLYNKELRSLCDLTIYVDPDTEIKYRWKIKRDVEERGHTLEAVKAEILRREPLYKEFIDFQKAYADVVVKIHPSRFDPASGIAVELIQKIPEVPLKEIDLSFDLSDLLSAAEREFGVEFRSGTYYGKEVTRLTFDGHIRHETVLGLESKVQDFVGMHDAILFDRDEEYTDAVGLAQLMICWRFLEKIDFLLRDLERALG